LSTQDPDERIVAAYGDRATAVGLSNEDKMDAVYCSGGDGQTMRILIAPDKFKGCLSALEVARAMERGIKKVDSSIETIICPMADGGEGTVETLVEATGGQIITLDVTGPLGEKVEAHYGILGDGKTAVIEMASASGLWLVPQEKRNPLLTTTYGTGELIKDALRREVEKILIGIGGSATNDGGMGAAQALGVKFYGEDGQELGLGGRELGRIAKMDPSGLDWRVKKVEVEVACDVENPLYGPRGAAYVYAPQKGATPEMVDFLDRGLAHYARKIKEYLGKEIKDVPGSGAAGGLGGGLLAFLDARLRPGVEIVKDVVGFREKLKGVQLLVTGEGALDEQTLSGKTPIGVAREAREAHIPTIAFAGSVTQKTQLLRDAGLEAVFSIAKGPVSLEESIGKAASLLESIVEEVMRVYLLGVRKNIPKGAKAM
jgi:glycerate kinase